MTIDERLEALAQSVELLTHDMHLQKLNHELQRLNKDNQVLAGEMMLAITRLANTAHAHNGQLTDHEERIDKLEEH